MGPFQPARQKDRRPGIMALMRYQAMKDRR